MEAGAVSIWKEAKCGDVGRPDDREVAAVERDDHVRVQALREGDDRGVYSAKRKVTIGFDELGDAGPIRRFWRYDLGVLQALDESSFYLWTQIPAD